MSDGAVGQSTTTDDIEVTHHASNQWEGEVDSPVRPENAWGADEPVGHPTGPRESAWYTRLYQTEGIVLLAHRDRVVTVVCLEEDPAPTQRSVRVSWSDGPSDEPPLHPPRL